jgi:hypothetical protein
MDFRVRPEDGPVHIAITPSQSSDLPMIEVILGAANNTRSMIRVSNDVDVVDMPTPNVLSIGEWNGFRVTWANNVVTVWRTGDFPFLVHSMVEFFDVQFYGLRTP